MNKQVEFIKAQIQLSEAMVRHISKRLAADVEAVKDHANSLTPQRSWDVQHIQGYIYSIQEANKELQAEMKKQEMLQYMLTIEEGEA